MKITAVKSFRLKVGHHNNVIVRVETDSGLSGLGVTLDESAADQHTFEFWEAPHWQRRDGSYTNW